MKKSSFIRIKIQMRDEIIAGLKNAIERGSTLEAAAQSFINAGYNPQEVRAATAALSEGVSDIIYQHSAEESSDLHHEILEAPHNPNPQPKSNQQNINIYRKEKRKGGRAAIITIVTLLLLIFLGALGYLIYYYVS